MNLDDQRFSRELGQDLRQRRLQRHWTQTELARRCELHRTFIGSVERGELGKIGLTTAGRSLQFARESDKGHPMTTTGLILAPPPASPDPRAVPTRQAGRTAGVPPAPVRMGVAAALLLLAFADPAPAVEPEQAPVFVSGQGGYHTYRIPSLLVTKKGTLLAFCEGRKKDRGDSGDIDLFLKRSFDGGKTWGPTQVVWDDGDNTCGNPCPVLDARTGTIWLLLTHNLGRDTEAMIVNGTSKGTRTVWVTRSEDDGATWARPVEITKDVKRSNWTWYATGPGVGIQLRSGRLVVPCDNQVAGSKVQQAHVIFSDDGGRTWKLGGVIGPQCDESQAVEAPR